MRERSTWAADRKASAPPAIPGYGVEDQEHPAHQDDPAYAEYKQGDPSAWAEDPKQPPYPQGNPPADPGYDVEDQDHPAHINPPRNPKNSSLKAQVEKKAAKCIRVARVMLGCDATSQMVEDQALDLMDVPEDNLDSMYARMSGGFLAAEEPKEEEEKVEEKDEEEKLAALLDAEADPVMARITAMQNEIDALKKAAGQNAPGGSQNNANKAGATEEQVKAEAKATAKDEEPGGGAAKAARQQVRQMLASWDTDGDGFLMKEDWMGNPKLFIKADFDDDGIVTIDEAMTPFFDDVGFDDGMGDLGLDDEETALMAELESQIACGPTAGKKADDEEKKEEEKVEEKVEETPAEEKKEAAAPVEAAKKADDDDDADDKKEEEVPAEEPAEEESKEASDAAMFSASGDPLADMTSGEDALLAEIFGGKTAKKADDDEDADDEPKEEPAEEPAEEEGDEKEGGKKKASDQHPVRPKTASGPKTLGTQVRTAGKSEINDLAKLWDSSPDVSAVFGVPKNNG